MSNIFTKHPKSVGESYSQHFLKSCSFSLLLLSLSLKAFIHAILPFLYVTSVSDKIMTLGESMKKRREKALNNN